MKRIACSLLLLIPLLGGLATAQEIEVTVDRTELARGETLTYTIRVFDERQGMQLDLTPLTEDFDVLGTRTSSQIRSINGAVESWTDYIVTLFPLAEGELEIPAITVNNTQTEPIAITVENQGPRSNQSPEELFLELEVNKEAVYVQEQLLFTVRLFYTINGIRNPQFTELEIEDTVIELIGSPNQYERLIDGVRYGVYEKRYVLFPQRSGPLAIPDILFRGEVTDGSSNFVFRNLNTRRVTAFIEGFTIDVRERPAAAQNSGFWLPVSSLTLEESFDRDLSGLQTGDSVVRTITMVAEGLDGAVLPPFSGVAIDRANTYPNPAEIDRTFVEGRIVGSRIEQSTIVFTEPGVIELPEIAIPWWNIDTDQAETTVLPATRVEVSAVAGAAPSEQAVAGVDNIEELLATVPVVDQEMIDAQSAAETIELDAAWLNLLIGLATLIVLFSIYRLVLQPRQPMLRAWLAQQRQQLAAHYHPANNERVAFRQLTRACRGSDPSSVREALIPWCNHFFQDIAVRSMEDLLQQRQFPELHRHVSDIQARLFNGGDTPPEPFSGSALLATVKQLRSGQQKRQKTQQRNDRYALPPLYRI